MERDRAYWLRLLRLALAALVTGAIGALTGVLLGAAHCYARTLTHPGCGDMGGTPDTAGIVGAQDVTCPSHDGPTACLVPAPPQNGVVVILLPGSGGGWDGMLRGGAIPAHHGYGLLLTETHSWPAATASPRSATWKHATCTRRRLGCAAGRGKIHLSQTRDARPGVSVTFLREKRARAGYGWPWRRQL